jgi:polyhydroxyalkanoate synthase subunit PhaC
VRRASAELALRASQAVTAWFGVALSASAADSDARPAPADPRFAAPAWQAEPFRHRARAFVLAEVFVVGRDRACTPGKVVLRSGLVEPIQYGPSTETVFAEPVLPVPAWIMSDYILDLSPHGSMVRWLVAQGHKVFCLSWRAVTPEHRELSLDDHRRLGVMAALDAINAIAPRTKVHAVGCCPGGTLLAIAAAAMARAGDARLASVTLLAARTDLTEPGEPQRFIDPAQVHRLDSAMWQRGYPAAEPMSGASRRLQSIDLIWSRVVHDERLGERAPKIGLMA